MNTNLKAKASSVSVFLGGPWSVVRTARCSAFSPELNQLSGIRGAETLRRFSVFQYFSISVRLDAAGIGAAPGWKMVNRRRFLLV